MCHISKLRFYVFSGPAGWACDIDARSIFTGVADAMSKRAVGGQSLGGTAALEAAGGRPQICVLTRGGAWLDKQTDPQAEGIQSGPPDGIRKALGPPLG